MSDPHPDPVTTIEPAAPHADWNGRRRFGTPRLEFVVRMWTALGLAFLATAGVMLWLFARALLGYAAYTSSADTLVEARAMIFVFFLVCAAPPVVLRSGAWPAAACLAIGAAAAWMSTSHTPPDAVLFIAYCGSLGLLDGVFERSAVAAAVTTPAGAVAGYAAYRLLIAFSPDYPPYPPSTGWVFMAAGAVHVLLGGASWIMHAKRPTRRRRNRRSRDSAGESA